MLPSAFKHRGYRRDRFSENQPYAKDAACSRHAIYSFNSFSEVLGVLVGHFVYKVLSLNAGFGSSSRDSLGEKVGAVLDVARRSVDRSGVWSDVFRDRIKFLFKSRLKGGYPGYIWNLTWEQNV